MKDHRSVGIAADSLYNSYEFYFGKRDRPMQSIPLRAFHNALRILHSLDYHEVTFIGEVSWESFRRDPYIFFITCSDANAVAIWRALQARQPAELRDPTKEIHTLLLDIAVMFENWERDSNIADPTGAVRGQRRSIALAIHKLLKKEKKEKIDG